MTKFTSTPQNHKINNSKNITLYNQLSLKNSFNQKEQHTRQTGQQTKGKEEVKNVGKPEKKTKDALNLKERIIYALR